MSNLPGPQLLSLAPELIQEIGNKAPIQDVKSLRLVCRKLSTLVEGDLFHSLEIHLHPYDRSGVYKRALEIFETLAKAKGHSVETATRKLVITNVSLPIKRNDHREITGDEFERRLKAALVPALQSLKNIRNIRLNYNFTKLDWVFHGVLESLNPIIPQLSGLDIYGIDSDKLWNPRNTALLTLLNDPRLLQLSHFSITTEGQGENQAFFASLITAMRTTLTKSSTRLKSFKCGLPAIWSQRPILHAVFGPDIPNSGFPALTHIALGSEIIPGSHICRGAPTLPQFTSLQRLDCLLVYRQGKANGTHQVHAGTLSFWELLADTGVRLRSIRNAIVSDELLKYLCSYSGELNELSVSCQHSAGSQQAQQAMGVEFWTRVIPLHCSFLREIQVHTSCMGWWIYGSKTQETLSAYSFPELRRLRIGVQKHERYSTVTDEPNKDYMATLVNLIVQSGNFPALVELNPDFPSYPVEHGWCGTSAINEQEEVARNQTSNLCGWTFPCIEDMKEVSGSPSSLRLTAGIREMRPPPKVAFFGSYSSFCLRPTEISGGWKYESTECLFTVEGLAMRFTSRLSQPAS
ncbi:hypothetical protein FA15DRAFT_674715 [Coprinopsis marcescibilis]|uniref:F-box domain-containing protein n=1 Tax=Coprinopsis marcescibilis TaxID=230819 RepID=A0A5C3KGH6_COPMA|nr:hypothetical protein FA15DRAFT_674715 [Coprinopsis marcescibilis]